MDPQQSTSAAARFLSEMLADSASAADLWAPGDCAALFRHQLAAPLWADLNPPAAERERLAALAAATTPPIETFGQLLHHTQPPWELLDAVKQFAKLAVGRPAAPLPEDVAQTLYALCIAAGLAHAACRLTELDDAALRPLFEKVLSEPWLDEPSRTVLRAALEKLAPPPAAETTAAPVMSGATPALGQLGEYTLLEKLGEGGMGTVYKARHTELDRLAAIKVMQPGLADEEWAAARFRREIKAAGVLDHPHIVRAYDARQVGAMLMLVMEYVDGRDLHSLVSRCGPLSVADACELIRQAALGLQCAHESGLVHRDIKPSNLILSRQGKLKILDLGLARFHADVRVSRALTAAGQMIGTPDFMAPEQFSDSHAVDIRADIYSLGCTLFMLLTGRAPFCGPRYTSLPAKLDAHRLEPPPPLRDSRADVPRALAKVVARLLAKRPRDRYATPGDVATALARFAAGADLGRVMQLADQPVAGARSAKPRAPSANRRMRLRTLFTAVAAIISLGLAAAGVWHYRHTAPPEETQALREASAVRSPTVPEATPAALAITASASAAPPEASLPGWIVMSWTDLGLGKPKLWLFRPDTSGARFQVTRDRWVCDIHPKFSPDGRKIAFIRGEDPLETGSVCVCNSDGSGFTTVVAPREKGELFAGPIWVSHTRLYYARDLKSASNPNVEIWQVDLAERMPSRVFGLREAVGKPRGFLTDVAPDGQRLALAAWQTAGQTTADIYVVDLQGQNAQTVYNDSPAEHRDCRALWSPDGTQIAWHHDFGRAASGKVQYYGVGLARAEAARFTVRLQPDTQGFATPLAWCPRGGQLLCARLDNMDRRLPSAKLFLMDGQSQAVRPLFDLEAVPWQPGERDLGRLADWAILPADITVGR